MRKLKDAALALIRNRAEQSLTSLFNTAITPKLSKLKGRDKSEALMKKMVKKTSNDNKDNKDNKDNNEIKGLKGNDDVRNEGRIEAGEGEEKGGKEADEDTDGWAILDDSYVSDRCPAPLQDDEEGDDDEDNDNDDSSSNHNNGLDEGNINEYDHHNSIVDNGDTQNQNNRDSDSDSGSGSESDSDSDDSNRSDSDSDSHGYSASSLTPHPNPQPYPNPNSIKSSRSGNSIHTFKSAMKSVKFSDTAKGVTEDEEKRMERGSESKVDKDMEWMAGKRVVGGLEMEVVKGGHKEEEERKLEKGEGEGVRDDDDDEEKEVEEVEEEESRRAGLAMMMGLDDSDSDNDSDDNKEKDDEEEEEVVQEDDEDGRFRDGGSNCNKHNTNNRRDESGIYHKICKNKGKGDDNEDGDNRGEDKHDSDNGLKRSLNEAVCVGGDGDKPDGSQSYTTVATISNENNVKTRKSSDNKIDVSDVTGVTDVRDEREERDQRDQRDEVTGGSEYRKDLHLAASSVFILTVGFRTVSARQYLHSKYLPMKSIFMTEDNQRYS